MQLQSLVKTFFLGQIFSHHGAEADRLYLLFRPLSQSSLMSLLNIGKAFQSVLLENSTCRGHELKLQFLLEFYLKAIGKFFATLAARKKRHRQQLSPKSFFESNHWFGLRLNFF